MTQQSEAERARHASPQFQQLAGLPGTCRSSTCKLCGRWDPCVVLSTSKYAPKLTFSILSARMFAAGHCDTPECITTDVVL